MDNRCSGKELLKAKLIEEARTGNAEKQFELACFYWKEHFYSQAERWFRYSAMQNHEQAQICLRAGIHNKDFMSALQRLNSQAIEILEQLVTPHPTEQQISNLEHFLYKYLEKEFSFNELNYEQE